MSNVVHRTCLGYTMCTWDTDSTMNNERQDSAQCKEECMQWSARRQTIYKVQNSVHAVGCSETGNTKAHEAVYTEECMQRSVQRQATLSKRCRTSAQNRVCTGVLGDRLRFTRRRHCNLSYCHHLHHAIPYVHHTKCNVTLPTPPGRGQRCR